MREHGWALLSSHRDTASGNRQSHTGTCGRCGQKTAFCQGSGLKNSLGLDVYLPASLEARTSTPASRICLDRALMSMTESSLFGPPLTQHWLSGQKPHTSLSLYPLLFPVCSKMMTAEPLAMPRCTANWDVWSEREGDSESQRKREREKLIIASYRSYGNSFDYIRLLDGQIERCIVFVPTRASLFFHLCEVTSWISFPKR